MLIAHLWAVPAVGQLLMDEPLVDNKGAIENSADRRPIRPATPGSVMSGAMSGLAGSPPTLQATSPTMQATSPTMPLTTAAPPAGGSPWLFSGQQGASPVARYSADPFGRAPITAPVPPGQWGFRHTIDYLTLGLLRPPQGRYQDLGQPLVRESWRYRPLSAGWFMGSLNGDVVKQDWLGMDSGFLGGYRLGWDYDHYWGCETRFSFASVELNDSWGARQSQLAADALLGIDPNSAWGRRFDERRDADIRMWDIDFLYYPWGDTAWRPYFLMGLGTGRIDAMDRLSNRRIKRVLGMPLGIGLKYRATNRVALRFEFADNIMFGSSHAGSPMHNLSLTGGIELRFGGTRKAYWPYNPGRHYW